jgi:hypothetical protein
MPARRRRRPGTAGPGAGLPRAGRRPGLRRRRRLKHPQQAPIALPRDSGGSTMGREKERWSGYTPVAGNSTPTAMSQRSQKPRTGLLTCDE